MWNYSKKFIESESGAVTVDFVVITGMVAGLGFAVVALIKPNLMPLVSGFEPALVAAPTLGAKLIAGE